MGSWVSASSIVGEYEVRRRRRKLRRYSVQMDEEVRRKKMEWRRGNDEWKSLVEKKMC